MWQSTYILIYLICDITGHVGLDAEDVGEEVAVRARALRLRPADGRGCAALARTPLRLRRHHPRDKRLGRGEIKYKFDEDAFWRPA